MSANRTLVLITATSVIALLAHHASGGTIASYSADLGSPANAGEIDNPTAQGWLESGTSGSTVEGVVDAGTNAWAISDTSSGGNPTYRQTMNASAFQDMFDNGWNYTVNADVVSAGGFSGWGVTSGTNPGWNFIGSTSRERMGAFYGVSSGNTTLGISGGPTFNFGPVASAGYRKVDFQGVSQSSRYRVSIDGTFYGTYDWANGSSNSGSDNRIQFASGSTGGTGRQVNWNTVSLASASAVTSEIFYDDFQSYTVDSTGPLDEAAFTNVWTQFGSTSGNGSRIYASGTGGGQFQSTGWITNAASGIYTSVAAASNTNYELTALLAAETSTTTSTVNFALRVLLGVDRLSAVEIALLNGSDNGGGGGKTVASNHSELDFSTGTVSSGDQLFIEVERTGGAPFLFVDDVALWATIPEPSASLLAALGLLGLTLRRRR